MKYEAPKIAVVFSAADCIQGDQKGDSRQIDMALGHTIGAYQADE